MIVALKTDSPVLELYGYEQGAIVKQVQQEVGRDMARVLPGLIEDFMGQIPIEGLIVFRGPGSFTGLRIGITVMNTLAYARDIPLVGTMGARWREDGLARLAAGENDQTVLPEYGAPAHVTTPRK